MTVLEAVIDLRERTGRHIGEAAITINDLRECHDTWVRKSGLMLEVGKNERTELRERATQNETDYSALGEKVQVLEKRMDAMDKHYHHIYQDGNTTRPVVQQTEVDYPEQPGGLREKAETLMRLVELREQVKIARASGNYDYDPYMHGMANGLICALATAEGVDPQYLDAPEKWLRDNPREGKPLEHPNVETLAAVNEAEQPTDETAVMGPAFLPPEQSDTPKTEKGTGTDRVTGEDKDRASCRRGDCDCPICAAVCWSGKCKAEEIE